MYSQLARHHYIYVVDAAVIVLGVVALDAVVGGGTFAKKRNVTPAFKPCDILPNLRMRDCSYRTLLNHLMRMLLTM